jgi:hypothetical protein
VVSMAKDFSHRSQWPETPTWLLGLHGLVAFFFLKKNNNLRNIIVFSRI